GPRTTNRTDGSRHEARAKTSRPFNRHVVRPTLPTVTTSLSRTSPGTKRSQSTPRYIARTGRIRPSCRTSAARRSDVGKTASAARSENLTFHLLAGLTKAPYVKSGRQATSYPQRSEERRV